MNLYPFLEIVDTCNALIKKGTACFQQWQCTHCKTKQTMPNPNVFYTKGICEECKGVTNIVETGHNYMAVMEIDARNIIMADNQVREV